MSSIAALLVGADGAGEVASAQRAVEHIAAEHVHARAVAEFALVIARQRTGQSGEAESELESILTHRANEHPARVRGAIGGRAYLCLAAADMHGLERVARLGLRTGEEPGLSVLTGWAHFFMGWVAYEWDDLDTAAAHFAAVSPLRERVHLRCLRNSLLGLALAQQRLGNATAAQRTIDEMLDFAEAAPDPQHIGVVRSFRAHLALLQGQVGDAVRLLRTVDLENVYPADMWDIEVPRLTEARVLINLRTEASLREATRKLDDLSEWHARRHETLRVIQTLTLLALALDSNGDSTAAFQALQRAISMARPRALMRTFIDMGAPLRQLLSRMVEQPGSLDYVGRLLAQFPEPEPASVTQTRLANGELMEDLTQREIEILGFLLQRWSNKEIAQQLVISPSTVKRHTVNLYQKLHVNSRRQAVARAQALGLITVTPSYTFLDLLNGAAKS